MSTATGARTATNLFYAEAAVHYVKSKIYQGAGNRWDDVKASGGDSLICQIGVRAGAYWDRIGNTKEKAMRLVAERAARAGCGNCAEQSALAFVYLEGIGLKPLEWMAFENGNHGYVVIDREPGKVAVADWGPDAVISDPWLGKWYRAAELSKHWPGMIPGLIVGIKSDGTIYEA